MAEVFFKSIDRRKFIKTTLAGLACIFTANVSSSFGDEKEQSVRWAFLADTHICEDLNNVNQGFNPAENLRTVVSKITADLPDGIAVAGDLAFDTGQPGDYTALKELLNPLLEKREVFFALGNHDDRANFLDCFTEIPGQKQSVREKLVTIVEMPPVRLILLDSLLFVDKSPGLLGKAQRQWLERYLGTSDNTPTILLVHHSWGDGDTDLLDMPYLLDIIKPVPKIKAVIYGHSHNYKISEVEGIHLINVPAVSYTFNRTQPVGWMEAQLTAKGGEFILHSIGGNQSLDGTITNLSWRKG